MLPRLGSSIMLCMPTLARACHNTTTPAKNAKATLKCCHALWLHGVIWGLSSAMIISSHNSTNSPDMEITPPKTACDCLCGEVLKINKWSQRTVTYTILWPYGMNLSMYICIYWMVPTVLSWGILQQQQSSVYSDVNLCQCDPRAEQAGQAYRRNHLHGCILLWLEISLFLFCGEDEPDPVDNRHDWSVERKKTRS